MSCDTFFVFFVTVLKGNSKKSINFIGAAPSLKIKLREDTSNASFKDLVINCCDEDEQFKPRSSKQVAYFRKGRNIGSDGLVTLHEIAYMVPQYVWSIRTFPDLVVCFGLPISVKWMMQCSNVILSYDTTFNLGDFYLSVLTIQLSAMQELPSIPVAFALHERKFQSVHKEFCENLKRQIRNVNNATVVTDGEVALAAAFQEVFPSWSVVGCWNHILSDIEIWLKKHNGQQQDIIIYKSHVRELLQSRNDGELATKLTTLRQTWSESFCSYYDSHIHDRITESYTGHLHDIGLTVDSITTNMSESLNAVIKRFQQWKELPPDQCLLSLYRLQIFYNVQIQRSFTGFGPYTPVNTDIVKGLSMCTRHRPLK